MTTKKIWANFIVKDIIRTVEFYKALGFTPDKQHGSENNASFLFGEHNFIINFFKEGIQPGMEGIIIPTNTGNEIMFSLSADNKDEVDNWVKKAKDAGGSIFRQAAEDENGFYYCGFADPDGHKFNVLLMQEGM